MKIVFNMKDGEPTIKVDNNQERKLDYDAMFDLIEIFIKIEQSDRNGNIEWSLSTDLNEKDRSISERYMKLVKELYNECQSSDFKNAVLKANNAEKELKEAEEKRINNAESLSD